MTIKRWKMGLGVFLPVSVTTSLAGDVWQIDSVKDWQTNQQRQENLVFEKDLAKPSAAQALYSSILNKSAEKRSVKNVLVEQSTAWLNWKQVPNIGPKNAQDAPVFLSVKKGDYWIFARYGGGAVNAMEVEILKIEEKVYKRKMTREEADAAIAKLRAAGNSTAGKKGGGFAIKDPSQRNGTGGEELGLGGYHAWHSTDMKSWVHHGPVSDYKSRWMTTAEYKDGKFYLYYDNPNDQDPHLIIDSDLRDGKVGNDIGLVFADPSNGSDNAVIRGADGKFHFIYEDWSPLNASKQAWDSPLAGHAISADGVKDWEILPPAVDLRTNATGRVLEYKHPHQYPAMLKYNEHLPKQDAFGDWAAILVGERYYLFADYDPAANKQGRKGMSAAWFTSDSLDTEFTFCGNIGSGHPDPDITFAEGKFYLITQFKQDFVSAGPWVAGVTGRVGVDTDNDGQVDQWTDWQEVKESYDHKPGFARQVVKTAASIDASTLPAGYGFKFELKISAEKGSVRPELDKVKVVFQ